MESERFHCRFVTLKLECMCLSIIVAFLSMVEVCLLEVSFQAFMDSLAAVGKGMQQKTRTDGQTNILFLFIHNTAKTAILALDYFV